MKTYWKIIPSVIPQNFIPQLHPQKFTGNTLHEPKNSQTSTNPKKIEKR
jgi:hypothetical protein